MLLVVIGGVAFLAVADLVVPRAAPQQFVALVTKTNALHIALTT